MFYIDQLRTPSFPIGLVKTESGFIVRSVETGLGRWTLMVAVISVDAYPFFGFLRSDVSPWRYRNRCFLVALCCGVVTFLVVWIFLRSMGIICYGRWVLSVCHKHYFKDWCLMNSQPTFLFLTYVNLKFVSTIFYQFFIFSPNDSPLKTTKNVFYFIWKALFVLKIFNFLWFFPFLSTLSKFKRTNGNGIIYDVMNWHA